MVDSVSVEHKYAMKWSLKVLIDLYTVLHFFMLVGSSCYPVLFSFRRFWQAVDASLSSLIYVGFRPFAAKFPCRYWRMQMNCLSVLDFMGRTSTLLLSYSYRTNKYFSPCWI